MHSFQFHQFNLLSTPDADEIVSEDSPAQSTVICICKAVML